MNKKKIMHNDLRILMTQSNFESIQLYDDSEYLSFNYGELLIQPLYREYETKNDKINLLKIMTDGQRIFYTFIELHKEIYNGGVAQFFWNQIELKDFAIKMFQTLGDIVLTKKYQDLLKDLDSKKNKLIDFKVKNDYANFAAYLDSVYFDVLFFDKVIALQSSMIKYIKENSSQFIKEQ